VLYFAGTLRPLRVYFFLSRTMRGRNWGVLTCLAIGFFRFGIDPPPCLGRAQHGEQPWPLEFGHGVVIVDPASARLGQTDDALGDGPASGALADVGQLEPAPAVLGQDGEHQHPDRDALVLRPIEVIDVVGQQHPLTGCPLVHLLHRPEHDLIEIGPVFTSGLSLAALLALASLPEIELALELGARHE